MRRATRFGDLCTFEQDGKSAVDPVSGTMLLPPTVQQTRCDPRVVAAEEAATKPPAEGSSADQQAEDSCARGAAPSLERCGERAVACPVVQREVKA